MLIRWMWPPRVALLGNGPGDLKVRAAIQPRGSVYTLRR